MITIKVNAQDVAHLNRMFDGISRALSAQGFRQFIVSEVEPRMDADTEDRFVAERSPLGTAWRQLQPATNRWREWDGFPPAHPINVRTEGLNTFVQTHDIIPVVTTGLEQEVHMLTPTKGDPILELKFKHAQGGGVSFWGNPFPARPVLGWKKGDLNTYTRMARDWFLDSFVGVQ